MPSYVITGASRGLGLGYARHLSSDPANTVFALVRDPSNAELQQLVETRNIHVIQADIKDYRSIKAAADEVSKITGGKLDVLINNAAILNHERNLLAVIDFPDEEKLESDLLLFFKTNVVGVTHTINAFLPMIRSGQAKKVIVLSSSMGSPSFALQNEYKNAVAYAVSKAGINMVVAKYAVACKEDGIIFLAVTPGVVKTMRGPQELVDAVYEKVTAQNRVGNPKFKGPITVEESVRDQMELFERITLADSGKFFHRNGKDGNLVED